MPMGNAGAAGVAALWLGAVFAAPAAGAPAGTPGAGGESGLPLIATFLPSRYNTPATPVGPQTFALAALADGSIVAANNAGLLRLDGTNASAWSPFPGNVLALGAGSDGRLYLGGIGVIGWVDRFGRGFESLGARANALGFALGDVWIAQPARDGNVYFADTTHVLRWDGKDLTLAYTGAPELLAAAPLGDGAAVLDPGKGLISIDADASAARGAHAIPGSERLLAVAPCALTGAGMALLSVCADGRVQRWTANGFEAECRSPTTCARCWPNPA